MVLHHAAGVSSMVISMQNMRSAPDRESEPRRQVSEVAGPRRSAHGARTKLDPSLALAVAAAEPFGGARLAGRVQIEDRRGAEASD